MRNTTYPSCLQLESDKALFENTLRNKLLKRQDELSRQLSEIELHDQQTTLTRQEMHLKEVEASIEENTKKQQGILLILNSLSFAFDLKLKISQ